MRDVSQTKMSSLLVLMLVTLGVTPWAHGQADSPGTVGFTQSAMSLPGDYAANPVWNSPSSSADWLKAGWDHASLWLGRRRAAPLVNNSFRTLPGWEVGVVGYDRHQRLTLAGFTADSRMTDSPSRSVREPRHYGWSLSLSEPRPLGEHWTISYGAGYTLGVLLWDYVDPPTLSDQKIDNDSLLYHGLAVPFTLGTEWGSAWVEVAATPTVRLFSARTRAGFRNNLAQVHLSVPFSLRLGVLF